MNFFHNKPPKRSLSQRVTDAATSALKYDGAVGPIDLLVYMRMIESVHFEQWQRLSPHYKILEEHIQCGPEKLSKIFRLFRQWASDSGLESSIVPYVTATRSGSRKLQLLIDEDPEHEQFLLTRYQRSDLTPARKKQIAKKQAKVPDLVVFILTSDDCQCSECGVEMGRGSWMYREEDQPLCLECADMDHLEFLPSGNATLTRRAKKFSPLSAVVMKFNRSRKRFQRQGILVTQAAIDEAESSMEADADQRERQRQRAMVQREKQDESLVESMIAEIARQFPHCPAEAATRIAEHTALRGSGRVGRSAAGREVAPQAIKLAVIAHIRHEHTPYDQLLMDGVPRDEARLQIQADLADQIEEWKSDA